MANPTFKIINNPSTAPVSVSNLRRQLSLWDDDSYDLELAQLLLTATEYVGNHIGRAISLLTIEMSVSSFDVATLFHNNTSAVIIKYYDVDDALQTLADTGYTVDPTVEPTTITFKTKPAISADYQNPVVIQYSTGMEFVPQVVRHAILMTAAELFEVKTESTDAQARVAAITISRLLGKDKRVVV